MFKGNSRGENIRGGGGGGGGGGGTFAEPELITFRKPKRVIQNKNIGHKIQIIVTTTIELYHGIVIGRSWTIQMWNGT